MAMSTLGSPAIDLEEVLSSPPPAFALLHRPESGGEPDRVDIVAGDVATVERLGDLPLAEASSALLAVVPYRQITERGYGCQDDGAPLVAMQIRRRGSTTTTELTRRCPESSTPLEGARFDIDDETYAAAVCDVLRDEIGRGEGSNFVLRREFLATIPHCSTREELAILRRLLLGETGAYWTFLVHLGCRTFIGATPERHVSVDSGRVVMNPISGTYRYPSDGPRLSEVLDFLADDKEADELHMVVDEELKMMSRVCPAGGWAEGPYLKEMARLAHTEYFVKGDSILDVRDILRETMLAPTVTGSPIENACRVIARHEAGGRGYYSGVLALMAADDNGRQSMDSAILIRTAEVDTAGRLRLGVGSSLVRLSDPDAEAAETRAKAAGMLDALVDRDAYHRVSADPSPQHPSSSELGTKPDVLSALRHRNSPLSKFWLLPASRRDVGARRLAGRVLVIDAEDAFTSMLAQELRALGLAVDLRSYDASGSTNGFDLVVVGPGPGDPRDAGDPRIAALRRVTCRLLSDRRRLLSVCLGHQVLASVLGLDLVRRDVPNQGVQLTVDLFGRNERVGFYNTFAARCDSARLRCTGLTEPVEVSRDSQTGEVYALRTAQFASVQFHPESLLTQNGPDILSGLVGHLTEGGHSRGRSKTGNRECEETPWIRTTARRGTTERRRRAIT